MPNGPLIAFNNAMDHAQAKTCALPDRFGGIKGFKNLVFLARCYPFPLVDNIDNDLLLLAKELYPDLSAFRGVIRRVHDKVEHDLGQLDRIGLDP